MKDCGEELVRSEEAARQGSPAFLVTVEGEPRTLNPAFQDEVYRVGRELLSNAFRHAQARCVEVIISYEGQQLRLSVRDDGKGIEPDILSAGGSSGHWGLLGMRERVRGLNGKLEVRSEPSRGTEAVLTVPAAAAYASASAAAASAVRRRKPRS